MGFFEEHPWALILLIILTVEAWCAAKASLKLLARYRNSAVLARFRTRSSPDKITSVEHE